MIVEMQTAVWKSLQLLARGNSSSERPLFRRLFKAVKPVLSAAPLPEGSCRCLSAILRGCFSR